jgi:hypothetical protein
MKGIVQQMLERESVVTVYNKFTQQDLDNLSVYISLAAEKDLEYKKERLKELRSNEKAIFKRAKELNKPIPLEVAYHCYLSYNKTYVGSEFLEKYKEWIE